MPESDARLGELLVACKVITRRELEESLRLQRNEGDHRQQLGEILTEDQSLQKSVLNAALSKQENNRSVRKQQKQMLRVDARRLDKLINLVGELVILGAGASLISQQSNNTQLIESMETMSNLVEEIRSGCLNLRMVAVGQTFSRFQRVVREGATA